MNTDKELQKTLTMCLDAIEVYSPDFMHGLPKKAYTKALRAALEAPRALATMTIREDGGADFNFHRPHILQPGQQFDLFPVGKGSEA
jgi:hypothetical protein